jgi:hypothetical protein
VWGEVHDTHIQIDPLKWIFIGDLLKEAKVKLPQNFAEALDPSQPIPTAKPKALDVKELQAMYKDKGVEPHRFALVEAQKLVSQPLLSESLMSPGFKGCCRDWTLTWRTSSKTPRWMAMPTTRSGICRSRSNQDTLVGVIRVKLPNGYSGSPCTAGSREYVTFWADFNNNGTFETCLGTTSVNVYDIDKIPKEGLEYAVFLPVDLSCRRRPCQEGPVVVRVRAILSWQVAPPCSNPSYIPVWGNREETLSISSRVHLRSGSHNPIIQTVAAWMCPTSTPHRAGNRPVPGWLPALDNPFGGIVIITGHRQHAEHQHGAVS